MVHLAADRASKLDINTDDIPATPTTRIYRILELLVRREAIVIRTDWKKG